MEAKNYPFHWSEMTCIKDSPLIVPEALLCALENPSYNSIKFQDEVVPEEKKTPTTTVDFEKLKTDLSSKLESSGIVKV